MVTDFSPRPAQKLIAAYRGGTLGVTAVPGSGKTWTLSFLAAELLRNGLLQPGQEILVVTLVNSAVHNFSQRISNFLSTYGMIPSLGYRVRTLHGLAHDIVRERPELAGLDVNFQIIDDREAIRLREEAVYSWMKAHPGGLDSFLIPDLSDRQARNLYDKQIPELLNQISLQFIRSAKNLLLPPESLGPLLENSRLPTSLANFGLEIYQTYQKNLSYRGAVDFDDLITKAFQILVQDPALLERLQRQWPYILEDEAQDSSQLQQMILSRLSSRQGQQNWVRVGDPNQAIYESFTTADPQLLIDFTAKADFSYSLPNSGRNTTDIIDLANRLVSWCREEHPVLQIRDALHPNRITPTPPGDAQPNPPSRPNAIHLYEKPLTPDEEAQLVARSVSNWLEEHPHATAAILAPRNERGKTIAGILRNSFQIEPVELLNSSLATRKTIGSLVKIISFLIDPSSAKKLSEVYKVFRRDRQNDQEAWQDVEKVSALLRSLSRTESYLAPGAEVDWLDRLEDGAETHRSELAAFRDAIQHWQQAVLLPVDQLILTISLDLFTEASELSLAHQLANFESQLASSHPDWELPTLLDELRSLARNERRFLGPGEDLRFNPEDHQGKVVVTTAHKAKGLEWDRVYLMSANNYNFPSGSPEDTYISEKWFIRDSLNLPAEALSILEQLQAPESLYAGEGEASEEARLEYVRERLRLFYVSITRAKQELIITWNTGRRGTSLPCLAFRALADYRSQIQTEQESYEI